MGIFSVGFVWPGDQISPENIVDPINYDSGACGIIDDIWQDAIWYASPHLGEVWMPPCLQADGSVAAWIYSWIYAEAHSHRAYVTPSQGIQLSVPTYSGIGGWNFLRRGLQWVELLWPDTGNKSYKFAWGADPDTIAWAGSRDYYQIVANLYGCAAKNDEGDSLGFWHTPSDADQIVRGWSSGYISDCFFVGEIRLYADLFFFPLPYFSMGQIGIAPIASIMFPLAGSLGGFAQIQGDNASVTIQRIKKRLL